MIDMRFLIRETLLQSEKVVDGVSKLNNCMPNISVNATTNAIYPLIIYREVSTEDRVMSDDEIEVYETRWEVSIFAEHGIDPDLKNAVDEAMHNIDFILYNSYEFTDVTTNVTHVIMKYRQTLTTEMYEMLKQRLEENKQEEV